MSSLQLNRFFRLHCNIGAYSTVLTLLSKNMSTDIKPRVYVTRRVPSRGIELLQPKCEITQWLSDDPVPREELLEKVRGIDALFCLLTDKIDATVLDAAGPQLKVVGTMSVGFDHVDLAACKERNIPVGYTPEVLTDATAELTVALLLATSRRLVEGVNAVKSGEWGTWKPLWLCGQGLLNSTVGIVGLGRIGMGVAKRLKPFGVQRILYSQKIKHPEDHECGAEYVPLDELYHNSDFVVACVALNSETKEMFNKDAFSKMKNSAVFVNSSRGGVVHQGDLYNALVAGEIRSAGLDVTTPEPLPIDNPLLSLPNCIVLPHIGSATDETRNLMSELTAKNILAVINGQPMPAQVKI